MLNYSNINENARLALHIAEAYAKDYRNLTINVSHLLLALMHRDVGLHVFLTSLNKDISYLIEWADVRIEEYPIKINNDSIRDLLADHKLTIVLEEADKVRLRLGLDLIDPICLLISVLKPNCGYTLNQLESLPLKSDAVFEQYSNTISFSNKFTNDTIEDDNLVVKSAAIKCSEALLTYCVNKNDRCKEGKLDPIIGRDKELSMMIEILGRRNKPNVLLIGDPGVGKSSLIDGLVAKIIAGEVSSLLQSAVVFELEASSLLAGASYKGEVEHRLKKIIKELKNYDKAILFIDELHSLIDKQIGGASIANLLKPELARGELTIIGVTTQEEYRKSIESDAAFNRRFETVTIAEPDHVTAIKMIEILLPNYVSHHGIFVSGQAVKASVALSKRYIKDKRLPDAAIDLLDRTLASVKMMNETSAKIIENVESDFNLVLNKLELSAQEKTIELKWVYSGLQNKISPILFSQLEHITVVSEIEIDEPIFIQKQIEYCIGKLKSKSVIIQSEITEHDVAAMISYKTGIPIGKIQMQEKDRLLTIESHLQKRVVGQDHAIKVLADTIVEARSGIHKPGQPIGSFFFLGPTGTGKTELAKSLAEFLFNNEKAMIRFDMSEFKEEHSAALLYGAPPGYVGYEEGGLLVNKIRQNPYSVVLFDEIEKAHHSVFDTFLQIMDEGTLHDKLGKEGDFSNAIIIFTSNIGSDWIAEEFGKGVHPSSSNLMNIMSNRLRPEFLARLTEIIPFAPITEKNVVNIFEIQLASLIESLSMLGISLVLTDCAKYNIATSGFTQKYGARQLAAVIRNRLRRPVAKMLIAGLLKKGDTLEIELESDGELLFDIRHAELIEQ